MDKYIAFATIVHEVYRYQSQERFFLTGGRLQADSPHAQWRFDLTSGGKK